ncbi:MAG TPA: class I SAM-dependent methyltransferase [Candidatus Krumholzibacteria bacterium]|nr:class I SAM-dependent methyltransferase [Candidatus Krumholzibacteria bacterium]HPD71938.1 class I SAM-dependent methyltransferase [Candidatus Krumholzibacteria bacterium]HRY41129.1 class I SAM-dependent methyltransferase [Candidatus Krumholzibacteria bacterium]
MKPDEVRLRSLVAAGNVLDLREAASHAAGHLRGCASLPLERALAAVPEPRRAAWLAENLPSIFLPPRHQPLTVVAEDPALAQAVANHLTNRGRPPVAAVALGADDLARLPSDLRSCGVSPVVLWRPPEFLQRWAHLLPPPAAGPLLDLACGSGRATVWLARRGWRVTGIDHQPDALDLAARLARSAGARVDLRLADLRQPADLPAGPWAGILMFRFLERPLVARLSRLLRPGSIVMLTTFRDAPGYVGNPRPRYRLARDEAATLWPPGSAEILVHVEGFDPDGKPTAGAVVRWTGPAGRSR